MQRIGLMSILTELNPSEILKLIILLLLGLAFVSSATMQATLLFLRETWARIICEHLFFIFYYHFELPCWHFMLKSWRQVWIITCEVRGGSLSLIALFLGLQHPGESQVMRLRWDARGLLECLFSSKVRILVLILIHGHELLIGIHEWLPNFLVILLGLN